MRWSLTLEIRMVTDLFECETLLGVMMEHTVDEVDEVEISN